MEAPFYIGQEVVALNSLPDGSRVKGKVYKVFGLDYCACGVWGIDIGDRGRLAYCVCAYCGSKDKTPTTIDWHNAKHFAPVAHLRVSSELTIADDLLQPQVEERADVEIVNA